MTSIMERLYQDGQAHAPTFVPASIVYETVMGSQAYGTASANSDVDVYGVCVPPLDDIFPHRRGEIIGFSTPRQRFEQYQQQGMTMNGTGYDLSVFSIVRYFRLVMDGNPNMVDSLFTPNVCLTHLTSVGRIMLDNRNLFLSKALFHKFVGYAVSQLHKMDNRKPEGKRQQVVEQYGYDVKAAYHTVRLLLEAEQVMTEGGLDLRRNCDLLLDIRAGRWSAQDIKDFFANKIPVVTQAYERSKLPDKADEYQLRQLLLSCLEEYYGEIL